MELFISILKPVLLALVSFLPSEEATTRTSILKEKWLKIWKSEENIDFNENFFVDSTSDENKQEQRKVFINFITNWITHFPSRSINRFSLTLSNPRTCGETIESCVAFATQRGVKELILDFSDSKWEDNDFDGKHALFQLPTHVHQLGLSLESLKLYSCGFNTQDFLNFGALKDLSLGWIEVKIETLKRLLSTCRTIESLSLEKCWNLGIFDLGDEPLGLTRLVVNKCDSEYFILNAPNLKYFKYSGAVFTSDINVRAIEEVDIDFSQESEFHERGNELCQILHDFSAAKTLTVCSYLLQVLFELIFFQIYIFMVTSKHCPFLLL